MAHSHSHRKTTSNVNKAFIIGILLNLVYVLVEFVVGYISNSMSLLSDAGHNLSDVFTLVLSLIAFRLAKVKNNDKLTYGYRKASILTALFNSVLLVIVVLVIGYQAIIRFFNPVEVNSISVIIMASIGIVINALSAFLFFREKNIDLNIKSAYLHLIADALVSLGVVVGGVIIYFTDLFWIDSVVSIIIAIIILYSTWELLKDSLMMALDAVPENVDIEKVTETILQTGNVQSLHHLHIWALSTTENALTVHIILKNTLDLNNSFELKEKLKHKLQELNISHATIEFETETDNCKDINK